MEEDRFVAEQFVVMAQEKRPHLQKVPMHSDHSQIVPREKKFIPNRLVSEDERLVGQSAWSETVFHPVELTNQLV
jgi:hypothetical protein